MRYGEFKVLQQEEKDKLDSIPLDKSDFDDKPMGEVRRILNRKYGYFINYHSEEELADYIAKRFGMEVHETVEYYVY